MHVYLVNNKLNYYYYYTNNKKCNSLLKNIKYKQKNDMTVNFILLI